MFELEKDDHVNSLIEITKSNSGISGPTLAKAHMELGGLLADKLPDMKPADTTIVAILRGGIFFAEGMYFKMGCRFETYDPKNGLFHRPESKHVILVDSVINTGRTIEKILDENMLIACCVASERAAALLGDQLYTIRVSHNSFEGAAVSVQKGTVGPDTTMRLFNQI